MAATTSISSKCAMTSARFVQMLREELGGDEQNLFVQSFYTFLSYNPTKDFVVDLDKAYEWAGFTLKGHAKTCMKKNLVKDIDYTLTPIPRTNMDRIKMTVNGFKKLCFSANTAKGKEFYGYYIRMEWVMLEYLRQYAEEQRVLAITTQVQLEKERDEKERLVLELEYHRSKTYEEILKDETVYIGKERVQLGTKRHKIGLSTDLKRHESALNCGSAEGIVVIYKRKTHNGRLVENIVKDALKRYRIGNNGGAEHYNNDVDHTMLLFNLACTITDTFASSYEAIGSDGLIDSLIDKLNVERVLANKIYESPPLAQNTIASHEVPMSDDKLAQWLQQEIQITGDKENDRVTFSKDFQWNNILPALKRFEKDSNVTLVALMKALKDFLQPRGLWKDAASVNSKHCVNVGCGIKVPW